jgi:hypothetical protein
MKTKYTISLVAVAAILGTTSFALAGDTSTFDAAVSVLSPDQTGFIIGGQVAVNGVGTGALTLARSNASMLLTGSASSLLDKDTRLLGGTFPATASLSDLGILDGVTSTAQITSSLAFDRSITTSGALVGLGAVTSRGEAIAALGSAGAASANTTTAGTRASGGSTFSTSTATIAGGEGNASADASSQGSLNGSLSTSNTLQLLGTSGLFAGSNGMFVGEDNDALAYGNSVVNADGTTGVALNTAQVVAPSGTTGNLTASGNGALFNVASSLTGAAGGTANTINMTVANAGNGSISLTTSTGGFFTGGGAAAGSASLADTTGSFFSPTFTTTTTTP